jgi:hypothetical protein
MSASTGCGHAVAFHIRRGTPKLVVQIKTIAAGLRVCIENLIRFDCAQSQQNLAFFAPRTRIEPISITLMLLKHHPQRETQTKTSLFFAPRTRKLRVYTKLEYLILNHRRPARVGQQRGAFQSLAFFCPPPRIGSRNETSKPHKGISPLPVALVEGRRRVQWYPPGTTDSLGARKAKAAHQINPVVAQSKIGRRPVDGFYARNFDLRQGRGRCLGRRQCPRLLRMCCKRPCRSHAYK